MIKDIQVWELDRQKRLESFDYLLDSIISISSKEKTLWKEIYDNAISDRERAVFVYTKVIMELSTQKPADVLQQYNFSAKILSDLLTRMEKSNAQLIKLGEMIQEAKQSELETDHSELLEEFQNMKEGTGG